MKANMVHDLLPQTFFHPPVDPIFGRLIDDFLGDSTLDPETGYEEMEDKYRIRVAVPGLSKKDLQLRLEANVLYLSGKARQSQQGKDAQVVEQHHFERSFVLPGGVDLSRIKARCRYGLLTITLPKLRAENKAKRIAVRGGEENGFSPRRWLAQAKRCLRGSCGNGSK